MPITTSWLIPERITLFHYEGVITVDELTTAAQEGIAFLESSPFPMVHTIQDSRNVIRFPTNVIKMGRIVQEANTHPKMGWMVSVTRDDPVLRFVTIMFTKLTRQRQKFTQDIPGALTFLKDVDPALPDVDSVVAGLDHKV